MRLADFDVPVFLRDYWQKQPLLIRSAWRDWSNPIDPDELAGLACEDEVESRLITQRGDAWELEQGPFAESRFAKVGPDPWTLLVQAVDHHDPGVAALLEPFRFVPNWRVDDVMVSYAADGGGVGAHFDNYDVFLVQGLGRRRWELGQWCDETTTLSPHEDLSLLAEFRLSAEWVLDPGDILYVPPRLAHRGVAVGDDCMTYSIGFRAPSRAELVENWSDAVLDRLEEGDRYADPDLAAQDNPGEIHPAAIAGLQRMIAESMLDQQGFARWFGCYSTAPKNPAIDWSPEHAADAGEVARSVAAGVALVRNPASRFSFIRDGEAGIVLFVDGHCFACRDEVAAFAESLAARPRLSTDPDCGPAVVELIVALLDQGSVAFEPAD